jgi:hypothetical protein
MGFQTDKFSLTTVVYEDTQQSAIALRDTGANIPTIEQIASLGIWLPNFDAIGDKLVFCHQFPHSFAEETSCTIYPHMHVITTGSSVNTIKFQLQYQWLNTLNLISTDTTDTVEFSGSDTQLQIVSFTPVVKASRLISSLFMGSLTRITNGGSDFNGEVYLAFFDVHFKTDTLGSNNEATKTFPS